MFAVRSIVRSAPAVTRQATQVRTTVVSGPPQNKIPFIEKVFFGGIMVTSLLAIPAWVLVNLKHYQKSGE